MRFTTRPRSPWPCPGSVHIWRALLPAPAYFAHCQRYIAALNQRTTARAIRHRRFLHRAGFVLPTCHPAAGMPPHSMSCWTRHIVRRAHRVVCSVAFCCPAPGSSPAVVRADALPQDVAASLGLPNSTPGTCSLPAGQPLRGFHELRQGFKPPTRWITPGPAPARRLCSIRVMSNA